MLRHRKGLLGDEEQLPHALSQGLSSAEPFLATRELASGGQSAQWPLFSMVFDGNPARKGCFEAESGPFRREIEATKLVRQAAQARDLRIQHEDQGQPLGTALFDSEIALRTWFCSQIKAKMRHLDPKAH